MTIKFPLVSIVTPVYNGEKYLGECIESVLNQSYRNWEYVVVNNCSKDKTPEIAEYYQGQDPRIRVHHNRDFLAMVSNFNHAMLQISDDSKYCKVIHADDLMFPDCLERMVAVAEAHPSVGIVGSYALEGVRVKFDGLPFPSSVFNGRDIGRWSLLDRSPVKGGFYVFGSPTTTMIRSDLVRGRNPFYQDRYHQVVDQEACYHLLQNCDFGFVHQVLTYTRLHEDSVTSSGKELNRRYPEEMMLLKEYGPIYLKPGEYEATMSRRMEKYYRLLSRHLFKGKNDDVWTYHAERLEKLGVPLKKSGLMKHLIGKKINRFTARINALN